MSTNGILDFQNTNKIIFRGSDSNVVIDTSNVSLGIGIQGTETPGSNLHVVGDAYISSNLKLTTDTSILVNSNVVADFTGPHGRDGAAVLKKYPEIAFDGEIGNFVSIPDKGDHNQTSNTYIIGGHKVVASSEYTHSSSRMSAWKLFDSGLTEGQYSGWGLVETFNAYNAANPGEYPSSGTARLATTDVDGNSIETGGWIYIKLPNKIKLKSYALKPWGIANRYGVGDYPKEFYIYASNDGTNWKLINSQPDAQTPSILGSTASSQETISYDVSQTGLGYYSYYAMTIRRINSVAVQAVQSDTTPLYMIIGDWKLYGYEEDPPLGDTSVDTTFTSIMNTPQTTGANVYVDAKLSSDFTNQVTGPTPVGTAAVHDNTNKYWEMNGQLTSNVTLEANTFLEGDQPHAVSVWFNSSNLEANVSNTCVFSISDQEHLNSQNLKLQSNTWHNLTYAYQGEGGSKVTYLDGRKVAEDQAEDTFGEYPPLEMTGYSQGGYVVSASSEHGTRIAWKAFESGTGNETGLFMFNETGPKYGPTANTNAVLFEGERGEWIKLELPEKIYIGWLFLRGSQGGSESPEQIRILGSNDDVNWDVVKDTFTVSIPGGDSNDAINSAKAYKYIVLQVIKVNGGTSVQIKQILYYGHRENDLVRLPDPTNVLKYPHIAMTTETTTVQGPKINPGAPGDRGYEIIYSNHGGTPQLPSRVFDGNTDATVGSYGWMTSGYTYDVSSGAFPGTSGASYSLTIDGTSRSGSWVGIKMLRKLKVTSVVYYPRIYTGYSHGWEIQDGYIVGSNDGISWDSLLTISGETGWTASPKTFTMNNNLGNYYQYFAILATKVQANNTVGRFAIQELEFYGTEEASPVPIQIGGGNIDKIANFRVYDKFIGEDQALEIWNAQKEEFGRAKPQMVLQQGKLGIGTDAPQGSLSVADEPHAPEEFPPRAMTANETYFEGHGVFKASSSSEYSATYTAFDAFDKITNNDVGVADNAWLSVNSSLYASASDYAFTGSTTLGNGTVAGEWLKLELPYKIVLKSITLSPRPNTGNHLNQAPEDFKIYGSNDDINWTEVLSETGAAPALWTGTDFITDTSSTTSYRYFAIVVQKTIGFAGFTAISGLKYFGTREQGQSVLHDGQLTLTKSLNVPRIGPALDADDTPRRDRLVVEYNTSTNPTFEGVVRDTSGRGNDGVFVGTAAYNANEKALVFDGDSDYIQGNLANSGDFDFSVSCWLKRDTVSGNVEVWYLGSETQNSGNTVGYGIGLQIQSGSSGIVYFFIIGGAEIQWNGGGSNFSAGAWNHIVCTRTGIDLKFYLNGTDIGVGLDSANGTDPLQLLPNSNFQIARRQGTPHYLDGSISNFKLYDTVLTAEEVKTLYDMGRLNNAVKTPLQIEAPVDIRGDIRYITNIRPLPKQTMWDHETNGHFTRGIYPITGTQGGSKVYNMLCEPDWCGGGWMCAAQLPRGKDIITTTVNLFTDEYGDPSNLTWSNDFVVPMDIFSNNSGYDLDVMLVLLGGRYAGKGGAGGARNGGIYRGVNLTQALNTGWPTNGSYPAYIGTSGLASSIDGFHFVSRSTSGNNFRPYKANGGWRLSFSSQGGYDMAYDDTDIYTMGWLLHTNGNNLEYAYSSVHSAGASQTQSGETSWAAVRFFVRPKRY